MAPNRRKVGELTRKNRVRDSAYQEGQIKFPPRCFVITRGIVGKDLKQLTQDFRQVMEPNTGSRLKKKTKNSIRDYLAVAGALKVTHLVIFSQTGLGLYMKLVRVPSGPTLTFRITNYSLNADVLSSQKKTFTPPTMLASSPCLMTNLQPKDGPLSHQLAARMFLDLFPTITPNKAKTASIQRCCLIHHSQDDDSQEETEEVDLGGEFDLRHYAIRVVPIGVSRAIRKVNKRKLPDLSGFNDVSEFMIRAGIGSESEGEEDPTTQVTVSSRVARRSRVTAMNKSSVKLYEVGPRLSLQLQKIEEGLLEGTTLYNRVIKKTDDEKLEQENKRRAKKTLKQQRKELQEKNVEAKKKKHEAHKKKCLEGMSSIRKVDQEVDEGEADIDDREYYRQEVGEEPDEELFGNNNGMKKRNMKGRADYIPTKKTKKNEEGESKDDNEDEKVSSKLTRKMRKGKIIQERKKKHHGRTENRVQMKKQQQGKIWGESKIKKTNKKRPVKKPRKI